MISSGKSSLSIQFVDNQFVDSYDPTIECSKLQLTILFVIFSFNLISTFVLAFTKQTRVNGQDYDLKLVDTAGQDEYSIFPTQYTMDIHGYVLVYSITSVKSFDVIQVIYDKLLDVTGKIQ